MSCDCDCNQPAVYRSNIQRARKAHTCYECSSQIAPGESHQYVFGVWDGDPGSFRTCSFCLELRSWVTDVADCQPCHGEILEGAGEELRNMSGPCAPQVRQQWWQGARLYIQAMRRLRAAREARRLRKAATLPALQSVGVQS